MVWTIRLNEQPRTAQGINISYTREHLATGAEAISDREQLGAFVHNNSLGDT